MRPTKKSRTQLLTNLKIELFSVLHVRPIEPFLIYGLVHLSVCDLDRLRTIISNDRICVLEAGQIAVSLLFLTWFIRFFQNSSLFQESDMPANLFALSDGIFRGMCEQSGITLDDIKFAKAKKDY